MSVEQWTTIVAGAPAVVVGVLCATLLKIAALARQVRGLARRVEAADRRLATFEASAESRAAAGVQEGSGEVVAPAGAEQSHAEQEAFVITQLAGDTQLARDGDPQAEQPPAGRIDGALFVDLVARETLVKSAGLLHGVRSALSPAVRNRIRFEMRREAKRARRDRRAEQKVAWREYQARQRAHVRLDGGDVA